MCGIAGYVKLSDRRVRPDVLQSISRDLLIGIETRGKDATGYGYVSKENNFAYVAKAPIRAGEFLAVEGHLLSKAQAKAMPWALLLHTRAATKGRPWNNENNHPVYSKKSGFCLVHNGIMTNDEVITETFGLTPDGEVDSEVYMRLVEHHYFGEANGHIPTAIQLATKEASGSFSCAMIQASNPGVLWLWKTTGVLELIRTDFGYVFASTVKPALEALHGKSVRSADLTYTKLLDLKSHMLVELADTGEVTVYDLPETKQAYHTVSEYQVWREGKWTTVTKGNHDKTKVLDKDGNSKDSTSSNVSGFLPAPSTETFANKAKPKSQKIDEKVETQDYGFGPYTPHLWE